MKELILYIITVGGTKGGSGKTTTAVNLAVCAAQEGKQVLLVDADPQGSSMAWRQLREDVKREDLPPIACTSCAASSIQKDLKVMSRGFDLTIVDVGGRDSNVLRASMIVSDIFITPASPAVYDLWAVEDTIEIIKEARSYGFEVPAFLLFNQVLPQRTILEREAKSAVDDFKIDMTLLNSFLYARQDYKNAAAEGLGCLEFNAKSKAAQECLELYCEVMELVKGGKK